MRLQQDPGCLDPGEAQVAAPAEAVPMTCPKGAGGPLPEPLSFSPGAASPKALLDSSVVPPPAPGLAVTTAISRTIRLYHPAGDIPASRPLVVLLPWFGARPRALAKYLSLYLGRSWPVLVVESSMGHFLWPRWGLAYAARVLGLLADGKALGARPLLIHAFSIGGYTFAQMMVHLASHPEQHASVQERICGLVYDSLVAGSLADMARGVARMTSSVVFHPLLHRVTLLYFCLFRRCTVAYYKAALDVFHHPPLRCPVLLFYCHNDPLSDVHVTQQLLDAWRAAGICVQVQAWQVSHHAGHLRLYPQEYTQALAAFLQHLGLVPGSLQAKL